MGAKARRSLAFCRDTVTGAAEELKSHLFYYFFPCNDARQLVLFISNVATHQGSAGAGHGSSEIREYLWSTSNRTQ